MADASFAKDYKPYAKDIPPYEPQPDFGLREREKPSYPKDFAPAARPRGARGIIGVRSSHSDGESSVADYVAAAKAAGLNFLVFCDPLENLTAENLAALREDCRRNSSVRLLNVCNSMQATSLRSGYCSRTALMVALSFDGDCAKSL